MEIGNYVWFNGSIIPTEQAKISLFTHTLHYGVGAFEGIRTYHQKDGTGAIFRLDDHLQRLLETSKILGLEIQYTLSALKKACIDLCSANQFTECYLRPIIFIGEAPLGLYPGRTPPVEVAILAWKWGAYLGQKSIQQGARLKISSFIRAHPNSAMTRGKITGQYVNSVLAKTEAIALGFDEALLLDEHGFLTEGSGENVFIIKHGIIYTTPLTSILNGITRQTVMQMLKAQKYTVHEKVFTRDELWCADEIFLTGTAAEITPVQEVDFKLIGSGKPGPITQLLAKQFHQMVRGSKAVLDPLDWLTTFQLSVNSSVVLTH